MKRRIYFAVALCLAVLIGVTNAASNIWGEWGPWDECSISCGGGTQARDRVCLTPRTCVGYDVDTDGCNVHDCPDSGSTPIQTVTAVLIIMVISFLLL